MQFRPIRLCNVNYKVLTKIIVQQIQPLLPKIVREEQSSFVPRRQIMKNIIIFQQIIHSMRNQKGKTKYMVVKVGLEKVHDKLKWPFIHETLIMASLPIMLFNVIMHYVFSPSMQVIRNGEVEKPFKPTRGIS